MNQAVDFGLLLGGGVLLVSVFSGRSLSQVLSGQPATPTSSSTGVAGVGQAITSLPGKVTGTGTGGGSVQSQLMAEFQAAGLSKAGAAAMVGNWTQESALNPSESGGYLAQWLGDRLTNLEAFAAQIGRPVTDVTTQVQFAMHELLTGYPGLLSELQTTNDPRQAALDVSNQYERPAAWAANNPAREQYAANAYYSSK